MRNRVVIEIIQDNTTNVAEAIARLLALGSNINIGFRVEVDGREVFAMANPEFWLGGDGPWPRK